MAASMASEASQENRRHRVDALKMGGAPEDGSLPVVAEEDDPNWGRQSTLPTMTTPVRGPAGTAAGSAAGVGASGEPQAREEDEAVLRNQWNRQNTAPVQRPFEAHAATPKGGGGGGFGGGRGGRGGGGPGGGGPVWYYQDWSGEHGYDPVRETTYHS